MRFFSKFERSFKKNMYNSIIQSIAHLKLWLFPIFLAICGFHPKKKIIVVYASNEWNILKKTHNDSSFPTQVRNIGTME